MSGRQFLTVTAIFAHCGLSFHSIPSQIRAWQTRHPHDPFPAPAAKSPFFAHPLFDLIEVTAWLERCCTDPAFVNNRMAQRFIRGEFDRPELQRQYQRKRIREQPSRRAA